MTHNDVFKRYNDVFKNIKTKMWFPNGKNCIRLRTLNGDDLIFTCNDSNDWRLETSKSYINDIS